MNPPNQTTLKFTLCVYQGYYRSLWFTHTLMWISINIYRSISYFTHTLFYTLQSIYYQRSKIPKKLSPPYSLILESFVKCWNNIVKLFIFFTAWLNAPRLLNLHWRKSNEIYTHATLPSAFAIMPLQKDLIVSSNTKEIKEKE